MKLLLDTDAFCKLELAGLLREAARLLGARLDQCGRLPALPHMLRHGRLRRVLGPDNCDALMPVADAMPIAPQPDAAWLDKLTPIGAIDPGEAQLFAAAAETGLILLSDDKRALRALKNVHEFADALEGRIIVLGAILLAFCDHLGADEVRRCIAPIAVYDKMVQTCFSSGNPDPRKALLSYYNSLAAELEPLVLWDPRIGGER